MRGFRVGLSSPFIARPRINPPAILAAFRQAVLAAGGEWVVIPGAVLRHDDNDLAAVFGGELADIARYWLAGEHADELRIDGFAPLRRQPDEGNGEFATG